MRNDAGRGEITKNVMVCGLWLQLRNRVDLAKKPTGKKITVIFCNASSVIRLGI